MSDLIENTQQAEHEEAQASFNEFKATLTEKQLEAYETLMIKRGYNGYGKLGKITKFFPEFKGVVYIKKAPYDEGRYILLAFSGKRSDADVYKFFNNPETARDYADKWAAGKINRLKEQEAQKEKQKSLTKRLKEFVKIDDVFYTSWGYEQTNVDYYKVVGFRGQSTLLLQQIGAHRLDGNSTISSAEKTPDLDHLIGEVFEKKAKVSQYSDDHPVLVRFTIDHQSASLKHKEADGSYRPDYYSWGY